MTALSPSYPASHRRHAEEVVARFGIAHRFVDTHEMESADYRANRPDRCYHCKSELFAVLGRVRDELGFAAVAYGINTDDRGDFRPGHRAAEERGVLSPFLDVGLGKAEIRALSRAHGLPTADLPASACLASRLPYGTQVTAERLAQVDAGEERLRALGFRQLRVRHHGTLARVEIDPAELPRALEPEMAKRIVAALKPLGFQFVVARSRGLPDRRAQRSAPGPAGGGPGQGVSRAASGVVACSGAPRDLGLDQGRAVRAAVRAAAAGCRSRRVSGSAPGGRAAHSARDAGRHFPHMSERLAGLARGAGVSRAALAALLARELARGGQRGGAAAALRAAGRTGAGALLARTLPAAGVVLCGAARPSTTGRSIELAPPWLVPAFAGVNARRPRGRGDRRGAARRARASRMRRARAPPRAGLPAALGHRAEGDRVVRAPAGGRTRFAPPRRCGAATRPRSGSRGAERAAAARRTAASSSARPTRRARSSSRRRSPRRGALTPAALADALGGGAASVVLDPPRARLRVGGERHAAPLGA